MPMGVEAHQLVTTGGSAHGCSDSLLSELHPRASDWSAWRTWPCPTFALQPSPSGDR